MTTFEIIIICAIYLFCYGFTLFMFIKEENAGLKNELKTLKEQIRELV